MPAATDVVAFSNVLTAPRECSVLESKKEALGVLTSADATPEARLRALSEVAAAVSAVHSAALGIEFFTPLLETASHTRLVSELVARASSLESGADIGHNGRPCRTIVGARGIGKTTLLQAFTYACKAAFPSLIPIYITAQDLGDQTCFKTVNLRQLLIAAARAHGVEVDESRGPLALKEALTAADRKMFIIVDEIDQLYSAGEAQADLRLNIMNTLYFLGVLGSQRTGRFSVLLCGSSSATYRLICNDAADFKDRFTLLKGGVPDLNSTKYKELPIPSAPCNDSKQVLGIINSLRLCPEATEQERFKLARILTFIGGTTPRAVASAIDSKTKTVAPAERLYDLVNEQLRGSRNLSSADAHASSTLFHMLVRMLQAANGPLLGRLRGTDGTCSVEELERESDATVLLGSGSMAPAATSALVAATGEHSESALVAPDGLPGIVVAEEVATAEAPWEHLVKPVALADVEREWVERAKIDKLPTRRGYLDLLLGSLQDASLVMVRQTASGRYVWPASAAQLVYGHLDSVGVAVMERVVTRAESLGRAIKPIGPLLGPLGKMFK